MRASQSPNANPRVSPSLNLNPRASTALKSMVAAAVNRPIIGETDINAEKQERYDRLRAEFNEIDVNKDKSVSYAEVKNFLSRKAGGSYDEALCQELFASMDKDQDSAVSLDEFIWSYVQAEETFKNRINQLERQIADNTQHLDEAKRKCNEAARVETKNQFGIMVGSVLTVHVREAKNLTPMDTGGTSDPYVILRCERQRIETNYIPNDLNPVWDEIFTFNIERGDGDLEVVVMDRDTIGRDDFEGQVSIPLKTLQDQLKHDKFFELRGKDPKEPWMGKIRLGLQWVWSKVEYFKTIIHQWEENLDLDKQELDHLKTQLAKLDAPFGHLVEARNYLPQRTAQKVNAQIKLEEFEMELNDKFDAAVVRTIGKNVDWGSLSFASMTAFITLCVLSMFARPDFVNVRATQVLLSVLIFFYLYSGKATASSLKLLAVAMVFSEVYDLVWFSSQGSGWLHSKDQESTLQGFCYFVSIINFVLKVPVAIVVWKMSLDVGQQA